MKYIKPVQPSLGRGSTAPRLHNGEDHVGFGGGKRGQGINNTKVCLKMLCTLHPMVLLIIIPTKWLFHWGINPIFRHTHQLTWAITEMAVGWAGYCSTNEKMMNSTRDILAMATLQACGKMTPEASPSKATWSKHVSKFLLIRVCNCWRNHPNVGNCC